MSATNITSKCRIASIELDDAMILPHAANPRWIKFSEGTGVAFKRAGDPNVGEFSDAVVLKRFGDVPNDLSEL